MRGVPFKALYTLFAKTVFVFGIILCFQHKSFSQHISDSSTLKEISTDELYQKYILGEGDPGEKILELLEQAKYDFFAKTNFSQAFRKLQIALILEKKFPKPDSVSFELYLVTAELISNINKGYALEFFKKATGIAKQADIHPARLFHMYTNRAGSHQYLMQYDSARFYYYKAIETAKIEGGVSESSTLNNLGYFFSHIGQHDSARIYFQKAILKLGDIGPHLEMYGAIRDNIAQLDFQTGHYAKALETYQNNDSIYQALDLDIDYLINKVRLLKTLEKLNDPDVHATILELQSFVDKNIDHLWDNHLLDFYQFANDYYFDKGDRENQIYYRQQFRLLSEKVEKDNIEKFDQLAQSLLAIQESGFNSEINAYEFKAESDKVKLRSIRYVAFAATISLLLIILLLILYIRQRRFEHQAAKKMAESELKTKEMEARLLQQDLELKKHDLTNVVLHNTQVYDSNRKIIERLEEIGEQRTNLDQHVRALLIELQSQNQISDRSIGLQSNIDSVNAEFYDNLKTKFPDLTKSEAELCGYIRIKLSTKDISILKNVAAASVKMGKNRLRKKLGLSPEADLYQFVSEI